MRGGVDGAGPAPADAGYGAFVATKDEIDSLGDGIPDPNCGVLRGGGKSRAVVIAQMERFPCQAVDPFSVPCQLLTYCLACVWIP